MGRHNEIARALDSAPDDFDPVFWEGAEGQVIVIDWAAGFLDAVALRPKFWEPLIRHGEAGVLMVPLLVLGADDPTRSPFGAPSLREAEIDRLHAVGTEAILGFVVGIHALAGAPGALRHGWCTAPGREHTPVVETRGTATALLPPKAPAGTECGPRAEW